MTGEESKTPGLFPLTRWSLVAEASGRPDRAASKALNELLQIYCPVLKKHLVRHLQFAPHRADDFVQNFVARKVLEKNVLASASAAKGRFRVYLLKILDNFAISEIRRQKARKRGPLNDQVASLDEAPDAAVSDERSHQAFDLDWARQTMARAVERMRSECDAKGRGDLWDVFACRVLEPALDDAPQPSYEALVQRFGFQSPTQASNLLITAKRMFRRALTDVVRDTVADEAQVEQEIRDLKAVLAG